MLPLDSRFRLGHEHVLYCVPSRMSWTAMPHGTPTVFAIAVVPGYGSPYSSMVAVRSCWAATLRSGSHGARLSKFN